MPKRNKKSADIDPIQGHQHDGEVDAKLTARINRDIKRQTRLGAKI